MLSINIHILSWTISFFTSFVLVDSTRQWRGGDDGLTNPTTSTSVPLCNDTVKQRFIDIIFKKDPSCLYHMILPDGDITEDECRCVLYIPYNTTLAAIGDSCKYDLSHQRSMLGLWESCNRTYDSNLTSTISTDKKDWIEKLAVDNTTIKNTKILSRNFLIPMALMIMMVATLISLIIYYSRMKNVETGIPDIEEVSVAKPRALSLTLPTGLTVECNIMDTPSFSDSIYQDWSSMGTPSHADYLNCAMMIDSPIGRNFSASSVCSLTAEEISSQTKFVIPEEDIIINTDSTLGFGVHGAVYTGCYHGTNVACKTVNGHLDAYLREGDLIFQLSSHPSNFIRYSVLFAIEIFANFTA